MKISSYSACFAFLGMILAAGVAQADTEKGEGTISSVLSASHIEIDLTKAADGKAPIAEVGDKARLLGQEADQAQKTSSVWIVKHVKGSVLLAVSEQPSDAPDQGLVGKKVVIISPLDTPKAPAATEDEKTAQVVKSEAPKAEIPKTESKQPAEVAKTKGEEEAPVAPDMEKADSAKSTNMEQDVEPIKQETASETLAPAPKSAASPDDTPSAVVEEKPKAAQKQDQAEAATPVVEAEKETVQKDMAAAPVKAVEQVVEKPAPKAEPQPEKPEPVAKTPTVEAKPVEQAKTVKAPKTSMTEPSVQQAEKPSDPVEPETKPVANVQEPANPEPAKIAQKPDYGARCDELAAHPHDPDATNSGVSYRDMKADDIIEACQMAIDQHPEVARYHAQLTRGLHKAGKLQEAAKTAQKGADLGSGHAMALLGVIHRNGIGVEKDEKTALDWFLKASDAGNPGGMIFAAATYRDGKGTKRDHKRAAELYLKAADLGIAEAKANLAIYYDRGQGLRRDAKLAAQNMLEAYKAGDKSAKKILLNTPTLLSLPTRKAIQSRLAQSGFYQGRVDGQLGSKSKKAIRAYGAVLMSTGSAPNDASEASEQTGAIKATQKLDKGQSETQ